MRNIVVKRVHVCYLISWWVSCWDMPANRQTNRQTDRQTDKNMPITILCTPCSSKVKMSGC